MSEEVPEALQYWDLVPAVVGGIIGALAGGIPAWLLAKRQSEETLRRDREQRTQEEKMLAFGVCVKLITIINSTVDIWSHVHQCLAVRTLESRKHMEPWQTLIPLIGFTDEGNVRFEANEMAVFEAAKERDFMMDAMLLAQRHASSISSFLEYCRKRENVLQLVPPPQQFEGQLGSTYLDEDQRALLKPHTIQLNIIAVSLANGLEKDLLLAKRVAAEFGPIAKRYFKDSTFPELTFPTDKELAKMRAPIDTSQIY